MWEADRIAEKDFINPPTGDELKRVLFSMHKIPPEGLKAQIIRWNPIGQKNGNNIGNFLKNSQTSVDKG